MKKLLGYCPHCKSKLHQENDIVFDEDTSLGEWIYVSWHPFIDSLRGGWVHRCKDGKEGILQKGDKNNGMV